VKAIAMLTRNRVALLPNLPTAHEQGLVNVEADVWFGFSFPRNTPDLIVRRLHQATVEAMATSAVRQRVEGLGATLVEPERATPEYLAGFVRSEIEKWAPPIRPVAYRWNDPRTTHDFRNGSKASGQQGGWHVRFTPDRARACRTVVFPAGSTTVGGRQFIASWMHEHARSVYAAIRG
jgi:Tripartite tricarboxylate transporter family receptor